MMATAALVAALIGAGPVAAQEQATEQELGTAGRDGILQHDWATTEGAGATSSFDSDIVFGDGVFQQWPEGDQS
jgi:hypothetical protein